MEFNVAVTVRPTLVPSRGHPASAVLRLAGYLFGSVLARGRVAILIYHRVLAEPDPMRAFEVDRSTFDWHMELVARYFTPLLLGEAIQKLHANCLPPRAVCVTFDDGYADNYDVALPILEKWRVPATFFVTTAYLNGGMMWGDSVIEAVRQAQGDVLDLSRLDLGVFSVTSMEKRAAAALAILLKVRSGHPRERLALVERLVEAIGAGQSASLMLTADQIRRMRAVGMEIGGHTVNHPILTKVSDDEGWNEIARNKEQLEAILGERLRLFAYPNGCPGKDYGTRHIDMVRRAGYTAAASTAWGAVTPTTDLYQLPRVMPWDATAIRFALRLLISYTDRAEFLSEET